MKMPRPLFLTFLVVFQLLVLVTRSSGYGGGGGWSNPFGLAEAEDGGLPEPKDEPVDERPVMANNTGDNLMVGFYDESCPNAEKIVEDWLRTLVQTNPNAMANLIRLAFHDCFVGGCDASILLDSTAAGDRVEKGSNFNGLLLKGANLIDDLKEKLEEECPETVSCADTLSFAANEAMALAGGIRQRPLGGRRDSLVSLASLVDDNNLALPTWTMNQVLNLFKRKGFETEEMAILMGAHSLGSAHCDLFMDRVCNFKNTQKPDPELPPPVVDELKNACANPGTAQFRNPSVEFDETPYMLDNRMFKNLVERKRSLLLTDSYLGTDPRTKPVVEQMAAMPELFTQRFAEVFTKMLSMNVITGADGEVRKTCRSTN